MGTIFKLIIEDDEGKTTVYPLAGRDVSIGRKEGNTIRLLERNVSRMHARLSKTNGTVFIEDLDSYNGVKINGERIAGRYEVKEGDLVEIGDYHLALQSTDIEDAVCDESTTTVAEAATQGGHWHHQGTVPDFRLPDEILTEPQMPRRKAPDTIVDSPPPVPPRPAPLPRLPTGAMFKDERVKSTGLDDDRQTVPAGSPAPVTALFGGAGRPENRRREAEPRVTVGPTTHSMVPRLVCVSTGYAGREFALTRPELVVGRVEDNDIVIEHRSVSRNHAKIVFDGRTHKIIDLQSANGILVNGEEYAMTDLRKGDLIELGHARFRFIPAQEPFYPTAEEAKAMQDAGIEPPPSVDDPPESSPNEAPTDLPSPAHDASNAPTVTDARRSSMIEARGPPPHLQSARDTGALDDTPPPRRVDVRRASDAGPPSSGSAAVESLDERVEALLDRADGGVRSRRDGAGAGSLFGGRRTLLPFFVVALAVVALVLLGMLVLGAPGEDKIRTLRMYAQDGRHAEVITYFTANRSDLQDSAEAWKLFDAARATRLPRLPAGAPDAPAPAPVPDEVAPDPLEVSPPPPSAAVGRDSRESVPERVALAPATSVPPVRKAKTLRRRGPMRRQRAKARYDSAFAHLMFNRTQQAISELDACLRIDERFADCHRLLGSTWAEQRDSARAVKHYRRYLQLAPNARDASQIRAWIESYESDR